MCFINGSFTVLIILLANSIKNLNANKTLANITHLQNSYVLALGLISWDHKIVVGLSSA